MINMLSEKVIWSNYGCRFLNITNTMIIKGKQTHVPELAYLRAGPTPIRSILGDVFNVHVGIDHWVRSSKTCWAFKKNFEMVMFS